jgi:hypothetical protein
MGWALLHIATGLEFPTVRAAAIEQLLSYADSDHVLKIIAVKKFEIQDWLIPGVDALAGRDFSLNQEDARCLSALGNAKEVMDLVLRITMIRERFVAHPHARPSFSSYHPSNTACVKCHPRRYHQVSTPCVGHVAVRSTYDFGPHICEVFGSPGDRVTPAQVNGAVVYYHKGSKIRDGLLHPSASTLGHIPQSDEEDAVETV